MNASGRVAAAGGDAAAPVSGWPPDVLSTFIVPGGRAARPSQRAPKCRARFPARVLPAAQRADGLAVDVDAGFRRVGPAHALDLEVAVLAHRAGQRRVAEDGDDLVG